MDILGYVIRKLKGSLRCAKEQGMVVGKNASVMGGVDFGSEPYLLIMMEEHGLFVMITSAIKVLLNMEPLKLESIPL